MNSATITGASGDAGTALAEVYDATPPGSTAGALPHLINLSALVPIGPGASLTAGFVIGGDTPRTVLIRATGPALAQAPFGVGGTMPDPMLTLNAIGGPFPGVVASDAGWSGNPRVAQVAAAVGAFALPSGGSADSVLLATLAPGSYSAQAASVSGAGGKALIEVFEVP